MKINSDDWTISLDKMLIKHKSGFFMTRKININTNTYDWIPSDNKKDKLACEALKYFYNKEGCELIMAYMKKYSFSEQNILDLINSEIEPYSGLTAFRVDYKDNLLMQVLNDGKPEQLTIEFLRKLLDGDAYCYPWISSSLRTAIYKWNKKRKNGVRPYI